MKTGPLGFPPHQPLVFRTKIARCLPTEALCLLNQTCQVGQPALLREKRSLDGTAKREQGAGGDSES